MEIAVDGWRSGANDWDAVRNLPVEQLPQLSEDQRAVARKLGIAEQDYARSVVAGERSREALLVKTERLARLLDQRIAALGIDGRINRVTLRTIQDRFDVEVQINGKIVPLRIDEAIADDYFDSGSADAEQRLAHILDRAFVGIRQ
jgi:hypothetical protein